MLHRFSRLLGMGLVGVGTLIGSSSVYGQATSQPKPSFLPAPESTDANPVTKERTPDPKDDRSVSVPIAPALTVRLEAIRVALANARNPEEIARCSLQEVEVLDQVAGSLSPTDSQPIIREIADCLCIAAAQEPAARIRLLGLEKQLVETMPGSDLAAYVTYREIQVGEAGLMPARHLHDRLAAFVVNYPEAGETPAALLQLGTSCEMIGKGEEAKVWYGQLVRSFPDSNDAGKAYGALRRLSLEGKKFSLALPLLFSEDERKDVVFDVDQLRGKMVIVYFWAAWQERCGADLAQFKEILDRHRAEGVELLCVNLDKTPQPARDCLHEAKSIGIHVFQRDGLDGIVAERFGIMSLPHVMVVGRDGVVIRQSAEITGLADVFGGPSHPAAPSELPLTSIDGTASEPR